MNKLKDYIKTLLKLAIQNNPEVLKVVRNAKVKNGGKGSGNFDHDGRPGEVGGSAPNNENVAQKYAQYNDLENDYKEFIANEPENYDINNIDEVLKDLGITPNQPLKIKTPIESVNITVKSIEYIVGGGGESHPPDVTRFKSINKMLATLKEPMFINEVDGQKYYFKIFQNDDKSKKDIVIVSPDNEVFTNFPVDRSNWFFKTLKQGKTIYDIKNKRRKSDNNAAHVNNIIPENREDFNPNIKNNVQNNKEQDMALIDELKKLITKVENEKPEGENMDDKEKVENEKVDKRKLIDEVAGIMKSAGADDEKIRTAIAKMEKLAYDKSEAGTADNACDDEDEVKNKKVKNEDDEDEKKYNDLKKDVKEDVENKCKNSVDNAKGGYFDKMNEIYNAATQPAEENTYISREQKLKYAEEYFAK